MAFAGSLFLAAAAGCISVNLPEAAPVSTKTYDLILPETFRKPAVALAVSQFVTDTPAKFKMVTRRGSVLETEEFSKWAQSPAPMLSRAFRVLFGESDDISSSSGNSAYWLEGNVYVFERNADTGTAELQVLYKLIRKENRDVVMEKLLKTSVKMDGDTPEAFVKAMSAAVVLQAEEIRKEIEKTALEEKKG